MAINGGFIAPGSYQNLAETDRQTLRHMAGAAPGVVDTDDFKVLPSSGMTLTANPGRAFLEGKNTTGQGFYFVWTIANETFSIPAAGSLPRVDRVVLAIRDPQYGAIPSGTDPGPAIVVVTGNPASSPTPRLDSEVTAAVGPGGWAEICKVNVTFGMTTVAAGNITDSRSFSFARKSPTMQVFTGSGTYTRPPGARKIKIRLVGGGGAGAGAAQVTSAANASVGGGGGGGGYCEKMMDATAITAAVAVTVGAGGAGVLGGGGGTGGTSSFGAYCQASGGGGGNFRGQYAMTAFQVAGGAPGGVGSGGDINATGGVGSPGWADSNNSVTGAGGSSALGGGAVGPATVASDVLSDGTTGGLPGGGGSGGAVKTAHSARTGGDGGKGMVIVETYFS